MINSTAAPFWIFRVREKKQLLALRQKARQIGHLLHFPPVEEACIAAGAFAVGIQAREAFGEFEVCFELDQHSLTVHARPIPTIGTAVEPKSLLKLTKSLPEAAKGYSVVDLGWLIARINEGTPIDLFGETRKQNEEILYLLHLLRHPEEHQLHGRNSSAA